MHTMPGELKEVNVQVGKRLKEIRENLGLTQEAFSEVLDVDAAHYRKLEKGKYGVSLDKIMILYNRFRVDPTYLITGDKKETVDLRLLLTNCDKEEHNRLIETMLVCIKQMLLQEN